MIRITEDGVRPFLLYEKEVRELKEYIDLLIESELDESARERLKGYDIVSEVPIGGYAEVKGISFPDDWQIDYDDVFYVTYNRVTTEVVIARLPKSRVLQMVIGASLDEKFPGVAVYVAAIRRYAGYNVVVDDIKKLLEDAFGSVDSVSFSGTTIMRVEIDDENHFVVVQDADDFVRVFADSEIAELLKDIEYVSKRGKFDEDTLGNIGLSSSVTEIVERFGKSIFAVF